MVLWELVTFIWAAPTEKVLSSMRKMCGFISFRTSSNSHTGICSPLKHSIVSNESVSGQWRPWSDCADGQADLGIRCPHMPEYTFSHDTLMIFNLLFRYILFCFIVNLIYFLVKGKNCSSYIFVVAQLPNIVCTSYQDAVRAFCCISQNGTQCWDIVASTSMQRHDVDASRRHRFGVNATLYKRRAPVGLVVRLQFSGDVEMLLQFVFAGIVRPLQLGWAGLAILLGYCKFKRNEPLLGVGVMVRTCYTCSRRLLLLHCHSEHCHSFFILFPFIF